MSCGRPTSTNARQFKELDLTLRSVASARRHEAPIPVLQATAESGALLHPKGETQMNLFHTSTSRNLAAIRKSVAILTAVECVVIVVILHLIARFA